MNGFGDATGFWIVALVLGSGIGLMLILGLLFARREAGEPELAQDIRLYRQQLAGIARDETRGVLSASEAQRLKAEIGRRLLESDRRNGGATAKEAGAASLLLPAALIVAAIIGAGMLYNHLGRPGQPDLPLASRLASAEARMTSRPTQAEYVARLPATIPAAPEPDMVEPLQKLRETVDPAVSDNLQGLELRATIEARLGNYPDAILAQTRLIGVKGAAAVPGDYAFLTLILVEQAQGYVSPEAEQAVVRGLGLATRQEMDEVAGLLLSATQGFQPQGADLARLNALPDVSETTGPLFLFGGELYAQGGRPDLAFALWRPLLEGGPADAFWVPRLREQIRAAAWFAGAWDYQPPEAATRGPDAAAIEAAAGLNSEEAGAMAEGMVAGLSARLLYEGGSGAEWAQLIRALIVLDRLPEARDMLGRARTAWPDATSGSDRALIEAAARALPAEGSPE